MFEGCVCCPKFSRNCIHVVSNTPSSFSSRRGGRKKFIARNVSARGEGGGGGGNLVVSFRGMMESFQFFTQLDANVYSSFFFVNSCKI